MFESLKFHCTGIFYVTKAYICKSILYCYESIYILHIGTLVSRFFTAIPIPGFVFLVGLGKNYITIFVYEI